MTEIEYLKIPAYAKLKSLSPEYCRRLIAKGIIPKSCCKKFGKRWQVNPKCADKALDENLSQINRKKSKQKKAVQKAGFESLNFSQARAKKEKYLAALRKLEYEQKSGQLIPADEVEREYFSIARTVRDGILNIPARVAAILSAESDPDKITKILTDEILQVLEALSK